MIEYNKLENWESDYYIATNQEIGTVVSTERVPGDDWEYMLFPVSKGDKVYVHAKGGKTPRALAILDDEYKMIFNSDYGELVEKTYNIEQDGFVIINNYTLHTAEPKVLHYPFSQDNTDLGRVYTTHNHGVDTTEDYQARNIGKGYIHDNPIDITKDVSEAHIDEYIKPVEGSKYLGPISAFSWFWNIYPVKKGDAYNVTGGSGSSPRLWIFMDENQNCLSWGNQNTYYSNHKIVADNDGYIGLCSQKNRANEPYKFIFLGNESNKENNRNIGTGYMNYVPNAEGKVYVDDVRCDILCNHKE